MKTQTGCLSCLIDDVSGALDLLDTGDDQRKMVLSRCLEYMNGQFSGPSGWSRTPGAHITELHRILKRSLGIEMPFSRLRSACNRIGTEIAKRLEDETDGLHWPEKFRKLTLWSIAGNHLDFRTVGTGYGVTAEELREQLGKLASEPLAVDHVDRIRELAEKPGRVLYVPDNVGEIAFDALLVRAIRSRGSTVLVPYRGGPITSDAILSDFEDTGLDSAADEIFEAGPDTLGFSLTEMSDRMRLELARADLVITKGQANFYALTEILDSIRGSAVCLLRTKCEYASAAAGVSGKAGIAAVLK